MDYLQQLGPLALASRLKYLSDRLMTGVSDIYKESGIDFEPRWFTVTHFLYLNGPSRITEISGHLGITHPAVVQVVNALEKKGYVERKNLKNDNRVSIIRLSKTGISLADSLTDIWQDISKAAQQLLDEAAPGFTAQLTGLETALDETPIYDRVVIESLRRSTSAMELKMFTKDDHQLFREWNYDWLKEHLKITDHDRKIIENPSIEILDRGGKIFMARIGRRVIGSFTITPVDRDSCELSKFVIDKRYRGLRLGNRMAELAIAKVEELGFQKIVLLTHPRLVSAMNLYKKKGFRVISGYPGLTDYTGRNSVTMELKL